MAAYDLNTAKQKVTDYTTSRYGRGPQDDQEWQQIGSGIKYDDGVDDNELNQAYSNADALAQKLGASPAPSPAPSPSPSPSPNAGAVPPMSGAPAMVQQPAVSPQIQQQMQSALQTLLSRGQEAPSLSDPTLAPQMEVFRSTAQRGAERQRGAAAERMAQQGLLHSGAFDTAVNQIEADRSFKEAQYGAGLLGQEQDARRRELLQTLGLAAEMGDQEAARALQREFGYADLGLRERGLGLQGELGRGDLGIRDRALTQQGQLGRGDLGLRLLQSLMQNDQFYSNLGLNAAQMQALLNQNAVMQLLGGF